MDFILNNNKYSCIKFRFYPRLSHMHSFDDEPPKDLEGVYKVYYSWCILETKNNCYSDESDYSAFVRVFSFDYDENSVLRFLDKAIRSIICHRTEKTELCSVGQPGSEWNIYYKEYFDLDENDEEIHVPERDYLLFQIWDNFSNKGYRFELSVDRAKEFCDYLCDINKHMLENGESI